MSSLRKNEGVAVEHLTHTLDNKHPDNLHGTSKSNHGGYVRSTQAISSKLRCTNDPEHKCPISYEDKNRVCKRKIIVEGDEHVCPIEGHGVTKLVVYPPDDIRPIINGKRVIKIGDKAECGAIITSGCIRFQL